MKIIKVELPETNQEFLEHWVKRYKAAVEEIRASESGTGTFVHPSVFKHRETAEQMVGRYYLRVMEK